MTGLPSTIEELEQLISDYMTAHIAERMQPVTAAQIAHAVNTYMQKYGAALEDSGSYGEVPMVEDDALDTDNSAVPLAKLSNGLPTSFFQVRVRALAAAAAKQVNRADVANPMIFHGSNETNVTITPNVLHVWGSVASLTISFRGDVADAVSEYMLQFAVGSDDFSLSLPNGIEWAEEPEWEVDNTYQVSIVNNLAIYGQWDVAGAIGTSQAVQLRITGRQTNGQENEYIQTEAASDGGSGSDGDLRMV